MEKNLTLNGKLCVVAFNHKEGYELRGLAVDMGYTTKIICFKVQEIAEVLDLTVRQLVELTPVVAGVRTCYYLV